MVDVRLDDVEGFGEDVDALFRQWRAAIEGAHNWSVRGPGVLGWSNTPTAKALAIAAPVAVEVAKVGGAGIPAMSGTTPGKGPVSLYAFDGATLKPVPGAAGAAVAFNMHPSEAVAANAWVKLCRVASGDLFVFWEPCA